MQLSTCFKNALKLSPVPAYQLALRVGLNPNTLTKFVIGYLKPRDWDPRLLEIGRLLGLEPEEVFEKPEDCDDE